MGDGLNAALEKMRADGAPDVAVENFRHYYERLASGETGTIPEDEIEPATGIPSAADLPEPGDEARELLDGAVAIRLNGGLGTSMGMTGPKSLLEVKDGLNFLDIIARQVLKMRERYGVRLPLVLMHKLPHARGVPRRAHALLGARGGRAARLRAGPSAEAARADGLAPVEWPDDPELEWAPPGHGDLYTSLVTSGMLDELLSTTATSTPSSPTPTTSARCSSRASSPGSRARSCRSRWRF